MTERFTASNGWEVHRLGDGQCSLTKRVGHRDETTWCGSDVYQAMAEYAQAERDAELGRWRSKEHPDFVVHRAYFGCRVLHEPTANVHEYRGKDTGSDIPITADLVAREWFDAQESPKPWQDARPGEVWVLTLDGREGVPMTVARDSDDVMSFWAGDDAWSRDDSGITAGRRIWPEPEGAGDE